MADPAFPPDRMATCDIPFIPKIEGDLIADCTLCETIPTPLVNLNFPIPLPPSFNYGCYGFPVPVIEVTADPDAPPLAAAVTYPDTNETGKCLPQLTLTVGPAASGGKKCGYTMTVKAATTDNITLAGEQTLDDIPLVDGDKALVKDQTDTTENGVYTVRTGPWEKEDIICCGTVVDVREGTRYKNTAWLLNNCTDTNDVPIPPGTNISFALIASIPCGTAKVATTGNISLNGLQTIDGVALKAGDTVLVKNQTSKHDNGLYEVGDANWERICFLYCGMIVPIREGGKAGTAFMLTSSDGDKIHDGGTCTDALDPDNAGQHYVFEQLQQDDEDIICDITCASSTLTVKKATHHWRCGVLVSVEDCT